MLARFWDRQIPLSFLITFCYQREKTNTMVQLLLRHSLISSFLFCIYSVFIAIILVSWLVSSRKIAVSVGNVLSFPCPQKHASCSGCQNVSSCRWERWSVVSFCTQPTGENAQRETRTLLFSHAFQHPKRRWNIFDLWITPNTYLSSSGLYSRALHCSSYY